MKSKINKNSSYIIAILTSSFLFFHLSCFANDGNYTLKGHITNKFVKPITLTISDIDKDYFYIAERNLEDSSLAPEVDTKISAENDSDYSLLIYENDIFIPKGTKFAGIISEVTEPKRFGKNGSYKVILDKAICPDGKEINLKSTITSDSFMKPFSPLHHLGKTSLGFLGGALTGTLLSYQLGGLGLAVSTHGYSLAAGAAAGGLIGSIVGVTSKGKKVSIAPGEKINIKPNIEVSFEELKQISCNPFIEKKAIDRNPENVKVEILSVKQKKEFFGDQLLRIGIKFINDSRTDYQISHLFLRDSQGKEYPVTFDDEDDDIFLKFPKRKTVESKIAFSVTYPKAHHWLILKDKLYSKDVGVWKIK